MVLLTSELRQSKRYIIYKYGEYPPTHFLLNQGRTLKLECGEYIHVIEFLLQIIQHDGDTFFYKVSWAIADIHYDLYTNNFFLCSTLNGSHMSKSVHLPKIELVLTVYLCMMCIVDVYLYTHMQVHW